MVGRVDLLRRPVVTLVLVGPYGTVRVEAIVDTGFNGHLAVPRDLVSRLGLLRYGPLSFHTAAGRAMVTQGYTIEVEWVSGRRRYVAAAVEIAECLIGTALLDGHVLEIDFGPAKSVEIR